LLLNRKADRLVYEPELGRKPFRAREVRDRLRSLDKTTLVGDNGNADGLRQVGTTGNLRMASMRALPGRANQRRSAKLSG